jgi:hypothetical protein
MRPNVEVTGGGTAGRPGREAQHGQRAPRGQGGMLWRLRLTDMLGAACAPCETVGLASRRNLPFFRGL